MRIRQIKPSFWEDSLVDTLSDSVKLFYIGTWGLADDGGHFEWNVAEVGRQLYGYRPRSARERWVRERGQALVDAGRLEIYECGHAYVPRLMEHQHLPGRKSTAVTTGHLRNCPQLSANIRESSPRLEVEGQVRGGTGGNGFTNPDALMRAIEDNQRIANDPDANPDAKRAAQRALKDLGVAA